MSSQPDSVTVRANILREAMWAVDEQLSNPVMPKVTPLAIPHLAGGWDSIMEASVSSFRPNYRKRKHSGGISLAGFTDRLWLGGLLQDAEDARRTLGPACKAVDKHINCGFAAVAREMTKARRMQARRDAKSNELKAA